MSGGNVAGRLSLVIELHYYSIVIYTLNKSSDAIRIENGMFNAKNLIIFEPALFFHKPFELIDFLQQMYV